MCLYIKDGWLVDKILTFYKKCEKYKVSGQIYIDNLNSVKKNAKISVDEVSMQMWKKKSTTRLEFLQKLSCNKMPSMIMYRNLLYDGWNRWMNIISQAF